MTAIVGLRLLHPAEKAIPSAQTTAHARPKIALRASALQRVRPKTQENSTLAALLAPMKLQYDDARTREIVTCGFTHRRMIYGYADSVRIILVIAVVDT